MRRQVREYDKLQGISSDAGQRSTVHDTRRQIVEEARRLKGTPHHHLGRSPGIGLDCWGTIQIPAHRVGFPCTDRKNYPSTGPSLLLQEVLKENEEFGWISPVGTSRDLEPGDLMVFWLTKANTPQHAGWFTVLNGVPSVLHCVHRLGVIEQPISDRWWRRYWWGYRLLVTPEETR